MAATVRRSLDGGDARGDVGEEEEEEEAMRFDRLGEVIA